MFIMFTILLKILIFTAIAVLTMRFMATTAIAYAVMKGIQAIVDSFYAYQTYKVPQFNENLQENQLYGKVHFYVQSLPGMEDSDSANLLTGSKSNEINVHLDANQTVNDSFLGSRLTWTNSPNAFHLRIRRSDKRRILRPYLQHIHTVADELDQRKKELRLYINKRGESGPDRWRSVPFTHPATMDTIAMDVDVKNRVKADLEQFVKSKQYYHRLGRFWRRSYLLYGPSGTGKSSFVAAMAKLLGFHVYDVDLTKIVDDSDLKVLICQTANKSIILVEDLDRFLNPKSEIEKKTSRVSLTGLLNFMDGLASSCGEERVMVFTVNSKESIDQSVLRPGRIDVHIHFPLCDFSSFKTLASSHLGLKEHKLFQQVEEMIQSGASLSPAEIGELMISNRSSPTRALKSVITALQTNAGEGGRVGGSGGHRRQPSGSGHGSEHTGEPESLICRESVHTVREFRKLYGLLRMRSRKEDPLSSEHGSVDKGL
ncbi:hypothetical protein QQ045_003745 [Rhodiola kirilowii]